MNISYCEVPMLSMINYKCDECGICFVSKEYVETHIMKKRQHLFKKMCSTMLKNDKRYREY